MENDLPCYVGRPYYVNVYTKESIWERPSERAHPSDEKVKMLLLTYVVPPVPVLSQSHYTLNTTNLVNIVVGLPFYYTSFIYMYDYLI